MAQVGRANLLSARLLPALLVSSSVVFAVGGATSAHAESGMTFFGTSVTADVDCGFLTPTTGTPETIEVFGPNEGGTFVDNRGVSFGPFVLLCDDWFHDGINLADLAPWPPDASVPPGEVRVVIKDTAFAFLWDFAEGDDSAQEWCKTFGTTRACVTTVAGDTTPPSCPSDRFIPISSDVAACDQARAILDRLAGRPLTEGFSAVATDFDNLSREKSQTILVCDRTTRCTPPHTAVVAKHLSHPEWYSDTPHSNSTGGGGRF